MDVLSRYRLGDRRDVVLLFVDPHVFLFLFVHLVQLSVGSIRIAFLLSFVSFLNLLSLKICLLIPVAARGWLRPDIRQLL